MAAVFVYPSHYEGFGIPVLEALCSGLPVLAATGSCLEEAGGPNSLYVDPNNANAIASRLNRILDNEKLREEMALKGLEYAKRFQATNQANELLKVYNELWAKE